MSPAENVASQGPVLVADRLSVRYGRTLALDSVSLAVEPGAVYALLGRNGAGKTSLMRCLLGHRRADQGSVRCFGLDCWLDRERTLARMSVVPEEPDVPRQMSAGMLATFFSRLYPRWDAGAFADQLSRFRIPVASPFKSLSKGQKTQLCLALALASRPEVLLLDDPTLGLDAVARRAILEEVVGELADRGTTILITSHDLSGIEGIALRVGILREGRMILEEPMESIKGRFRKVAVGDGAASPELRAALSPLRPLRVRDHAWGTEAWVQGYSEEALEAFRRDSGAPGAEGSPMTLEEIFIALCGEEGGVA
jgi:ABC-2 type transport system ATP-binding protein